MLCTSPPVDRAMGNGDCTIEVCRFAKSYPPTRPDSATGKFWASDVGACVHVWGISRGEMSPQALAGIIMHTSSSKSLV